MTENDPVTDDDCTLADRIRALEHELGRLRDELDAHRAALVEEVRTQRLIVIDRHGFERIVAEGGGNHGYLAVRARSLTSGSAKVELFADDPVDGDAMNVGVALGTGGDIVATLEVGGRGEPGLWINEADDP